MFIVNDELLETLTCSDCKKYLSVKPIKCYPNMGIRCGRCATSSDAGTVSLFGVLAERALFRCVNRFEGCNKLLGYADVGEHERICVGSNYDCPCCEAPFRGTAYDIYVHFKQKHKNLLLNNTPEFSIEIDNEKSKTYLYRKNDLLFYVYAKFTIGEEQLVLNVTYLGTDPDASKITQTFELRSLDGNLQHKTKKKPCCSVSEGCLQYFKVNVSQEDYSKGIVVCRVELVTNYVDSLVVLPEKYDEPAKAMTDEEINNNNESVIAGKEAIEDKENQLGSDSSNIGENKKKNQENSSSNLAETPKTSINPEPQNRIENSTPLVTNKPESKKCSTVQNSNADTQADSTSTASSLPSAIIDQVPNDLEPSTPRRDQPLNKMTLLDEPIPHQVKETVPIPSGSSGSTLRGIKIGQFISNQIGRPNRMPNQQPFVFCQNNSPVYVNQPSIHISNKTVNQVNNNIYIRQTQQKEIQKQTYPCTECGRVITSQIGLWSHMRTHRPKSPCLPRVEHKPRVAAGRNQGGGMFSCPECGRVISSQIGLWSHIRMHK